MSTAQPEQPATTRTERAAATRTDRPAAGAGAAAVGARAAGGFVLLLARLIVLSEINLMMDSTLLPIDKVYEAITAPSKRRKIVLRKRETSVELPIEFIDRAVFEICFCFDLLVEEALARFDLCSAGHDSGVMEAKLFRSFKRLLVYVK